MSASSTRRRLRLLTGSSLAAALVMGGAGGLSLATPALAANECGDPATNTTAADVFTCAGSFAAISYPTTNGNLTLNLQNNVTTTTGGLVVTVTPLATTTVAIGRAADSPANSGDPSLTSTSTINAALQVTRDAGGAITVSLSDNDTTDTPMTISGVSGGVRLQNAGTAATSFSSSNGTITASAGAGIEATSTGTGSVTVTNGSAVTGSTWGVRAGTTGAGAVSITNNGAITGTTGAVLVTGGTNATISNAATFELNGAMTLNNTGVSTISNVGVWNAVGASFLGDGATTVTTNVVGRIGTNEGGAATTINFGLGTNTFASAGQLAVGTGTEAPATLFLTNLTNWNNAGAVLFGFDPLNGPSDGVANDRVVAAGTLFTGLVVEESPFAGTRFSFSSLVMDADFSADQAGCTAAVSADCLDLRGSSTAGTTQVVVNVTGVGPAQRVVLIDVAGAGTSAASHFTLSTQSPTYHAVGTTGVVEGGLFLYELQYDPAAKQHALVATALSGKSLEVARIGRAASEPWRTATGLWHGRQADLRASIADRASGTAPGVWLKLGGNFINETRYDSVQVAALGQVEYNTGYDQRTTALVGGVDLVRASGDNTAWVVGVTAGSLTSDLEYDSAASELELEGYSFGAYASFLAGPLFVDGIVNLTNLDLTHNDLGQAFESSANSIGYQVEGGYRLFQIGDGAAFIEPIAAVSYVRTELDDLQVATVGASFDDATSLRGAVGARFAGDLVMDALTAQFSFTGRIWKEFETENTATLSAAFGDTLVTDEGPDVLGDLGVALGLFTLGNRLSAQLSYGVSFNEGYRSTDAGLSVRLNW